MWMDSEQPPSYPLTGAQSESYSYSGCMPVRYLPTILSFSEVVEKKEENVVLHRNRVTLSINPILIH